jgi:hypothetical protein
MDLVLLWSVSLVLQSVSLVLLWSLSLVLLCRVYLVLLRSVNAYI